MINSGINKLNVQPICPYYPEDYYVLNVDENDINTEIYTASANKVLLIFGVSSNIKPTGGRGIIRVQLREYDDSIISYPFSLYVLETLVTYDNHTFNPPVEVSAGRDLYLFGDNIDYCGISFICVERSYI